MKIAIVTFELEGLTRNAGIGTAYRQLAELLNAQGHEVTVVFTPVEMEAGSPLDPSRWSSEISEFRRRGISIVIPHDDRVGRQPGQVGYFLSRSHLVFRYLRGRNFDLVHAPDNCALVYISLQAKQSGKEFAHTRFVIGAHGPRLWTDELNGTVSRPALLMSYLDQCSVEMADTLISPSHYMIGYLKLKKWRLPKDLRVIPNVNRLDALRRSTARTDSTAPGTIVFFGRLETRKGVSLFVEAIRKLLGNDPGLGMREPLKLLFLGKDPLCGGKTISRIRRELSPFRKRLSVRFVSHLSSKESLGLLAEMRGALVCMPSLADNSPYVLVEAIEASLNLLATRSGGQGELIHPADRKSALCRAKSDDLCRAIARRLKGPALSIRPSREAVLANREWVRFHSRASTGEARRPRYRIPKAPRSPRVSVVLDSMNALGSVMRQDLDNVEICVPSDGKWKVPGRESGQVRFKQYRPRKRGSAVRSACEAASGEYVLFLDDALATRSSLGEWVRAFDAALGNEPATIGVSGVVSSGNQERILFSALWKRRWLLERARKEPVDLSNDEGLHRLYSSLFLSGGKIGFMPEVVVVEPS